MSKNVVVIFAGGSGVRMGAGKPKQFLEVNGKPIIIHTLELFEEHPAIDEIYVACKEDYIKKLSKLVDKSWITKVKAIVPGGTSALGSIHNGLRAAAEECSADDIVLIHDGVRPCIVPEVIDNIIAATEAKGAAITCTPLFETPVFSEGGEIVERIPLRDHCYTAQAPQCFRLGQVLESFDKVSAENPEFSGMFDSGSLMRSCGYDVAIVKGNRGNIKVTTPEDLYIFRAMMQYRESQDAFGFAAGETAGKGIK